MDYKQSSGSSKLDSNVFIDFQNKLAIVEFTSSRRDWNSNSKEWFNLDYDGLKSVNNF